MDPIGSANSDGVLVTVLIFKIRLLTQIKMRFSEKFFRKLPNFHLLLKPVYNIFNLSNLLGGEF